jgi:hypothetical protein
MIKKILILFTFFFLFILQTKSQVAFHETFGGSVGGAGLSVAKTIDGYIISGQTGDSVNSYAALIKIGFNGDTIWTRQYDQGGNNGSNAVIKSADGSYVHAGFTDTYGAYLAKTSSTGNLLWFKGYSALFSTWPGSVSQTSDGGYFIVGGTAYQSNAYAIKAGISGFAQWAKIFDDSQNMQCYSGQQTVDNGYIVSGYYRDSALAAYFVVIKTDSAGNVVWSKKYSGANYSGACCIKQTSDGGYALAGSAGGGPLPNVALIKIDASGNVEWTKTYGGSNGDVAYNFEKTSDNGFIICGYTDSFGPDSLSGYLIKTDSSGNLQWSKTYGNSNWNIFTSVLQANDDGYLLCGNESNQFAYYWHIYLIKTDSAGNSGCNETNPPTVEGTLVTNVTNIVLAPLSGGGTNTVTPANPTTISFNIHCTSNSLNELNEDVAINISPNPFTTQLTIHSTANTQSTIALYDYTGKEILCTKSNSAETVLNTENIAAGFYLLRVESEKGVANYKVVKQQ